MATEGTAVLVVPCYNEADRLRPEAFVQALARYPSLRLLFVDDGSRDATGRILKELVAGSDDRATVLALGRNTGKAEAVRRGLLLAFDLRPAFVGYWDADLATPFEALADFLEVLRHKAAIEVVVGSRVRLLGRDIRRSARRHYIGRVFATAASLVLDLPVYDTQCGAKLFRATEEIQGLLTRPFQTRWIFDVELIARYLEERRVEDGTIPAAARIYELALRTWIDEPGSKVRTWDGVRALADLWRIYKVRRSGRS